MTHFEADEAAYAWNTHAYDGPDDRPDRVELAHDDAHRAGKWCGDAGCEG